MRMCMKRLLSKHGYNVALFDSGVALLSRGDFSDALCVIIDINLHDQSGIDLRRQLADKGVRLPVIWSTTASPGTLRGSPVLGRDQNPSSKPAACPASFAANAHQSGDRQ